MPVIFYVLFLINLASVLCIILAPTNNIPLINCTTFGETILKAGEFVKFESFNYPSSPQLDDGGYFSCYHKFKRADENLNIWFVFLNGEISSFDITGLSSNIDYERKTLVWDLQPLWFTSIMEWPEMEFHLNDYMGAPSPSWWEGFQAFVYAPVSINNIHGNSDCPLNGIDFNFTNTLDIIPISSSFYYPNKIENDQPNSTLSCTWRFVTSPKFMIKVHIKDFTMNNETMSLNILLDGLEDVQIMESGIYYYNTTKISINYEVNSNNYSSDIGFGGIVTVVELNPIINNNCRISWNQNDLYFENYNLSDGYSNNQLCETQINIQENQSFLFYYAGYLEDGVDKLLAIDNFNNTYDISQSKFWVYWIIDEKVANVTLRFISDGSLIKDGFKVNGEIVCYSLMLAPKIKLRPNSTDIINIYQNQIFFENITAETTVVNHYIFERYNNDVEIHFESDDKLYGIYSDYYADFTFMVVTYNIDMLIIDLTDNDFMLTLDMTLYFTYTFITINAPIEYTLDFFVVGSDDELKVIFLYDSTSTYNFINMLNNLPRHKVYTDMRYYTSTSQSLTFFRNEYAWQHFIMFFRLREIHAANCESFDNVVTLNNATIKMESSNNGSCYLTVLNWNSNTSSWCQSHYFELTTDSLDYVKFIPDNEQFQYITLTTSSPNEIPEVKLNDTFFEFNNETVQTWSRLFFYGLSNAFIIPPNTAISFKSMRYTGNFTVSRFLKKLWDKFSVNMLHDITTINVFLQIEYEQIDFFSEEIKVTFEMLTAGEITLTFKLDENQILSTKIEIKESKEMDRLKKLYSHDNEQVYNIPKKNLINNININVVGIDLGTSRCCAAVNRRNGIETMALDNAGEQLLPSYVGFEETQPKCGREVVRRMQHYAKSIVFDAKRIIGKNYTEVKIDKSWPFEVIDLDNKPIIRVHGPNGEIEKQPEEVSAELLKHIKQKCEELQGKELNEVVITVPAAFNEHQKLATYAAGIYAGFKIIHLLAEPIAASIAYFADKSIPPDFVTLLFDLGGGTLDICIFKVANNKLEFITNHGDGYLGGRDFDQLLFEHFFKLFKDQFKINVKEKDTLKYRLMQECMNIKHTLSTEPKSGLDVADFSHDFNDYLEISRIDFESMAKPLLNRIQALLIETMAKANYVSKDISKVLLVGGGCRMPMIRELLLKMFSSSEHSCNENPDEIVAIGAAYYASYINTQNNSNCSLM